MPSVSETQLEERLKAIGELKTAYQTIFGEGDPARVAAVRAVAMDLATFCRADEPTWSEDARHHARLEGRREVWLHINHWLRKPEEVLLQRIIGDNYTVVKVDQEDEE